MVFSQFQANGPVLSQINMGSPKQPQRCDHEHGPSPADEPSEMIVGKRKCRREQIEHWQQEYGWEHRGEQYLFDTIKLPNGLLLGFRSLDKVVTNRALDDEPNQEYRVWNLQNIHPLTAAPQTFWLEASVSSQVACSQSFGGSHLRLWDLS